MISVYQLKAKFQNMLRPLCAGLAAKGVSANQVTLAALIASMAYGLALWWGGGLVWILLPVFLFVRMGLNAIDGMLAREHNMKSRLGMALNELGDVIADTALFIPFVVLAPQAAPTVMLFILLAALTEFCGLLAFMMSGTRRYDGPMGKSDRAAMTGLIGFVFGLGFDISAYMPWVFAIAAALCAWTCWNRIKGALKSGENA